MPKSEKGPKSPKCLKGRLSGTQTSCGPANTAKPAIGVACDPRARKDQRAGLQGRKGVAAPQTPQGLLSGKHAMCGPGKFEGPVRRHEMGLRPSKLRKACCQKSIRCAAPESPNGLFSNKFERHFAARSPIAAQTPICNLNANLLPNASLQPKRQFAYLMHFRSPEGFQLPKRMFTRGAAPQRPQGLLPGKHAMCAPEKSEGPVDRDAMELRPRKHRRAGCRVSMRCACPKSPKGRLTGTQSIYGPANTPGSAVREACDVRARKDRRAG